MTSINILYVKKNIYYIYFFVFDTNNIIWGNKVCQNDNMIILANLACINVPLISIHCDKFQDPIFFCKLYNDIDKKILFSK